MKSIFNKYLIMIGLIGVSINLLAQEVPPYKELIDKEQGQKALELAKQFALQNPALPHANYVLGNTLLRTKKLEEATEIFQKGIQESPKEAMNYAGMGHVLILEGNKAEAEAMLQRALALSKSKDAWVLAAVAEAYLTESQEANKAVALIEKANEILPKNAEILTIAGDAYLLQNNAGLAVSSYEKALDANPNYAKAAYKIGRVYIRSKNHSVAEEAFLKAIQIDSEYTLAYKELGELYYLSRKADKAVEMYQHYLRLTENPKLGKMRYAFFLFMAKEYQKANDVFKELSGADNNNPLLLRFYAYSLFESGEIMQSREIFDRYFQSASENEIEASDFTYFGKVFLKLGEDSLAVQQFQKALSKDLKQVEVWQLIGETCFKAKRYTESIHAYQQLIPLRKKALAQDYFAMGRAMYFNQNYGAADSAFQQVINLQPEMPAGYLWQARAKSNLDPETEEGLARSTYETLAQKAASDPAKYKTELVEAYSYLGYYHFLKNETSVSKDFWQKVLALDAQNEKAKEAIKALK